MTPGSFGSSVHHALQHHAAVQETLERLGSCQDGDFSRSLLRMSAYLNRIVINCRELPNSIVVGIGSAIACLSSKQGSSVATYKANRSKCIGGSVRIPPKKKKNFSDDSWSFFFKFFLI